LFYCIFNLRIIIAVSLLVSLLMVPRTSVQVQSRSKLMPAMYCITHKIIRLSQVICANCSRKLFRFRVRQFSGLKYYFYMKNNSVPKFILSLSRFPVYRGSVLGRFYCINKTYVATFNSDRCKILQTWQSRKACKLQASFFIALN